MKTASFFLTAIAVGCLVAVVLLSSTGKVKDFETETYKVALQLLLVTVTGQIITLVITRSTQTREEIISRDVFRLGLVDRLNHAYIGVKKLRRLMRGISVRDRGKPVAIEETLYREFLSQLNDTQLSLEILSKDIESAQALFVNYKELQIHVDSIEEYLNRIVDEFEETTVQTVGTPPKIQYDDCPRIADLIGDYKSSQFRKRFVHPYYKALELLREQLLYIGKHMSRKRPLSIQHRSVQTLPHR